MGILDRAIHAATGVPRLYTAALRAGLGPSGGVEVLRISQAALQAAAAHGRGVPGRTNAMRHFMWQAALTARFGVDAARAIASAQHNNAVGQAYGAEHAADLTAGSASAAMAVLVPVALEKWESDELVWVKPH